MKITKETIIKNTKNCKKNQLTYNSQQQADVNINITWIRLKGNSSWKNNNIL